MSLNDTDLSGLLPAPPSIAGLLFHCSIERLSRRASNSNSTFVWLLVNCSDSINPTQIAVPTIWVGLILDDQGNYVPFRDDKYWFGFTPVIGASWEF